MMQSLVKLRNKKKGFTLVELIVVIAIIGILAAILMPKFMGFADDARKSAALTEAKNIRSIAETYYAQFGEWPDASATTDFQIPSGKKANGTDPDYTNSPTFKGELDDVNLTKGAFAYTKDKFVATCTEEGIITVAPEGSS